MGRRVGLLVATLLITGCARRETKRPEQPETTRVASPTPPPAPAPPPAPPRPQPHYRAVKLSGAHDLADLEGALGEHKFALFLKVNRVDLKHVRDTDTLAVPDSTLDTLDVSPLPLQLEPATGLPKVILVSLRVQAFGAYENGKLVRWGPVSSGKKATPTPAGLYHANWKAKQRYSTVDDSWLLKWCVNIEVHEGVSLHEYELPGRPASHSCVRLLADDAEWVYNWVDQWKLDAQQKLAAPGTPVLVFGDYAWRERAPWKRLLSDPLAATVSADEASAAWTKAGTPGPTAPEVPKPAGADTLSAPPDSASAPADTVARAN
jgi:L,D-transpeptidase-like protein